jgi:hypothetical protein
MSRKLVSPWLGLSLAMALVSVGRASAQVFPEIITVQAQAPKKTPEVPPDSKPDGPKTDASSPDTPAFAPITSAALGDSQVALSAPSMIGDFGGILGRRTVLAPTFTTITNTVVTKTFITDSSAPPTVTTNVFTTKSLLNVPISVYVPAAGRDGSGFKIADGETPLPTDRVFFTWNGFNDLHGRSGSFAGASSSAFSTTGFEVVVVGISLVGLKIDTTTNSSTAPIKLNPVGDLQSEIFGFEKTFLDGNASIEMRLPVYQGIGDSAGDFNGDHFGDVTTVLKYAFLRDPQGLSFSAGLGVTLPTGQGVDLDTGMVRSVLFQPFVGYIYRFGDVYLQGFTSIVLSTSSEDPELLFNDIGVGYQFYKGPRGAFLRSIDSVLEAHVTTPLDNRSTNSQIIVSDIVSLTEGLQFGIGERSFLSLGINNPISGPRPYGIEAIVNFDYRF